MSLTRKDPSLPSIQKKWRHKSKVGYRAVWFSTFFDKNMPEPARCAITRYYDELRLHPASYDEKRERRMCRRFAKSSDLAEAASDFLSAGCDERALTDLIDRALHVPNEWWHESDLSRGEKLEKLKKLSRILEGCSSFIKSDQRLLNSVGGISLVIEPGFRGRPVSNQLKIQKQDNIDAAGSRVSNASVGPKILIQTTNLTANEVKSLKIGLARARKAFSERPMEPDVPLPPVQNKKSAREYANANQFEDFWSEAIHVKLVDRLYDLRSKTPVTRARALFDLRRLIEIHDSIRKAIHSKIELIGAGSRTVQTSETAFAIRELVSVAPVERGKKSQRKGTAENRLIEVLLDLTVPRPHNDVNRRRLISLAKTRRGRVSRTAA